MHSVEEYINAIAEDKKEVFLRLRELVRTNLPSGFQETMSYGMLGYVVPLSVYPEGYHCNPTLPLPFIQLAAQKNFLAMYHMGIYANPAVHDWFVEAYPKHAKYKLDMGKSCIRFKRLDDIPFDLLAELMTKFSVEQWIELYESAFKK